MFFPVRDVEKLIFELLDPTSLGNLAQVNRYCSIKVQQTTWRQNLKKINLPSNGCFSGSAQYMKKNNPLYTKCLLFETACHRGDYRIIQACLSFTLIKERYLTNDYFIRCIYRTGDHTMYQWLAIHLLHPRCLPQLIKQLKHYGPTEALPWTEQYYASLPK